MLDQACDKSDKISKDVTSLSTSCSKLVDILGQAVPTQLVDSLYLDLLQVVRFLLVYSEDDNTIIDNLLTAQDST